MLPKGLQRACQQGKRHVWLGRAAHEDVDGRELRFRPGVYGDVGFREQHHAGHSFLVTKTVKVTAQDARTGAGGGTPQQCFERGAVAQALSGHAMKIGEHVLPAR